MSAPVEVVQTTWEFEQLLSLVVVRDSILEVGIWEGGTLWHWLQRASVVVGIDDTMRDPGPDVWQSWADAADLHLLHGSSQDPAIIAQAWEHAPYGFVFIDADHTYTSVKADWDNYRDMVEPGGIVAFHDIVPRDGYGVSDLWGEIKLEHRTIEIIDGGGRFNGIGVVWL